MAELRDLVDAGRSAAELPPAVSSLDAARVALCLGKVGAREQRVVLLTFQEHRSAEERSRYVTGRPAAPEDVETAGARDWMTTDGRPRDVRNRAPGKN
jgi:hypothetical protein